jgi:acyl dehydratase
MVHATHAKHGPDPHRPCLRRATEFGRPLLDSTFTVALVTGQSVTDVSQNVPANLGWDEIRLSAPVFEGDMIYSMSEVLESATPARARALAS